MEREEPRREVAMHGSGMGVATEADIEKRARELAELDDRSPDQVTDEDRIRARKELRGENLETSVGGERESHADVPRNPGEPAAKHGKAAPRTEEPDEQQFMEEEIKEGVRAAEHERSVRAHEEQPDSTTSE